MTVLAVTVVAVASSRTPPFVYSDQAFQLKALQQSLREETPSLNHVTLPCDDDISKGCSQWIYWWPPGFPFIAWPWIRGGLPIGIAVRSIALLCTLAGSLGWTFWWRRFELPSALYWIVPVLLPFQRFANNGIFEFSSESLVYALSPWLILAALELKPYVLDTRVSLLRAGSTCAAFGFICGASYVLKYSAIFVGISAMLYLTTAVIRADSVKRAGAVGTFLSLGAASPIALITVINQFQAGTANLVTASLSPHFDLEQGLFIASSPSLVLADAGSMVQWAFLNQDHGLWRHDSAPTIIGLPGTVLVLVTLYRGKTSDAIKAASMVLFTSMALLLLAGVLSDGVAEHDPRFLVPGGLALCPAVVSQFMFSRLWSPMAKWVFAVGVIFYVLVPAFLYSPAATATKVFRSRAYRTAGEKLYNPLIANRNARSAIEALVAVYREGDVWYVPEPLTALELPGRMIITHADFESIDDIRKRAFATSRSLRVLVLLPPRFEGNGKADAIRRSFESAGPWTRHEIPDSNYELWMTLVRAQESATATTVEDLRRSRARNHAIKCENAEPAVDLRRKRWFLTKQTLRAYLGAEPFLFPLAQAWDPTLDTIAIARKP